MRYDLEKIRRSGIARNSANISRIGLKQIGRFTALVCKLAALPSTGLALPKETTRKKQ